MGSCCFRRRSGSRLFEASWLTLGASFVRFLVDCVGLSSGWWTAVAEFMLARGSPGAPDPLPARQPRTTCQREGPQALRQSERLSVVSCLQSARRGLRPHEANIAAGGTVTHVEIGEFLSSGQGPEQQELLRLIGTLSTEHPTPEHPG
jgi:hypothetical protein